MKQNNRETLTKYAVCFGVEILIVFLVIWLKGFFGESTAANLQILADAFFVAGALMTMVSGLLFISGEGGFVGLSFVLRNTVLSFLPMGRAKQERYADYRERKTNEAKIRNHRSILVTGLFFLGVGIILTIIWYVKFYNA